MTIALTAGLFALMVVLPLLPGLVELRRRRDAEPLPISATYSRDPRFFGSSLRSKLEPHLAEVERAADVGTVVLEVAMRRPERVEIARSHEVHPGTTRSGILAALEGLTIGARAAVAEVYCRGSVHVEKGAKARAIAARGDVWLAPDVEIGRWVDAEGEVHVSHGCRLGVSASAGGRLVVESAVTFQRLWGMPIRAGKEVEEAVENDQAPPTPVISDTLVWADRVLALPASLRVESDVVSHGGVRVGERAEVLGSVKSHGDVVIGAGAFVDGNVVARGRVFAEAGSRITGHVFAEGDVSLGPGVVVGGPAAHVTVYGARSVTLEAGSSVHGWVVAEQGGRT